MAGRATAFIDAFRELTGLRFSRFAFALGVLFVLLMIALPAWKVLPSSYGSEVIPIHYNIHYGVDKTGPWWRIFTLPAIGLGVLLVNTVAVTIFWNHDKMLSRYVAGMTVIVQTILLIAMVFVVLLNMSYG